MLPDFSDCCHNFLIVAKKIQLVVTELSDCYTGLSDCCLNFLVADLLPEFSDCCQNFLIVEIVDG